MKFETHRHSSSNEELRVHKVTKETAGDYSVIGGSRNVHEGEMLVETTRPGVYDVYSERDFSDLGLDPVGKETVSEPVTDEETDFSDEDDESEAFNPSDHNASEVRQYLRRSDVSDEEKARVRQAERDGLNRKVD